MPLYTKNGSIPTSNPDNSSGWTIAPDPPTNVPTGYTVFWASRYWVVMPPPPGPTENNGWSWYVDRGWVHQTTQQVWRDTSWYLNNGWEISQPPGEIPYIAWSGSFQATNPVCFLRGTLISCNVGSQFVEAIKRTTQIVNSHQKLVNTKWIGYQRRTPEFAQFQDYLPVKISAGAVDDDVPIRDLYLSPDHAVLVDGHLIHAKALVNGKSIVQMTEWEGDIEYYHIETEKHEIIFAEGLPCETFIDNVSREQFDNYAEYQALYPNTRMMKELPLPRVKFKRQLPLAIKQRLESRIIELDRQNKG